MPYIGNSPGTGTRNRFIFTATASQTTFSGADDNGKTLAYSDGDYVDVYLNGICLVPVDDYAATSKTSIVLTVGAAASDTLEVVAYDIATIADTVSKANGGTFNSIVTFEDGIVSTTGGTNNVSIGANALDALDASSPGADNIAIGTNALGSNTTASDNLAIGSDALLSNTTSTQNTAVGYYALRANTAGNNTAVGFGAGYRISSGASNTAIGNYALQSSTSAPETTAVGHQAGYLQTTGGYNAFFGVSAGYAVTTGQENTFLGRFSGSAVTTGTGNVIVGKYDGNNNGLDIRTSNYNIVMSDGAGIPMLFYKDAGSGGSRGAWGIQGGDGVVRLTQHNPNYVALANGSTFTVTSTENGALLVAVYEQGSGSGALYFSNYGGGTSIISSSGSYSFGTGSGSGQINLYKSSPSHGLILQNYSTGGTKNINVFIVGGRAA